MTKLPDTMCQTIIEVSDALNLGITMEELSNSPTSNAVLQGTSLGIYYNNGLFLSLNFLIGENCIITDIASYDAAPFGSSPFYLFLDGTVLLCGKRLRVLYDDEDRGINDGVNIHVSQLIKDLILNRHYPY